MQLYICLFHFSIYKKKGEKKRKEKRETYAVMELELGLKITHTRGDVTSSKDLRIAKDRTGPVFLSRETDTMFTLIGYFKGFRRENIDIKINEDGDQIAISGQRPVQEMVLMGWIMLKKDVELRTFRKVFRIPDGINLNRIKAKFNDEESTLTIVMPKLVKGMRGIEIEEVKEEEVDRGTPETTQPVADKVPDEREHREREIKKVEDIGQVVQQEIDTREPEIVQVAANEVPSKEIDEEAKKEEILEPRIEGGEETDQRKEKAFDEVQLEATKEVAELFPERENNEGTPKENIEVATIEGKEETERIVEDKEYEDESKKLQEMAEVAPERDVDITLKEEAAIENEIEEAATPEEAEPAITAAYPEKEAEPREVEPEKEIEQPQTEEETLVKEAQSEELPDLKELQKKEETTEAQSVQEEKFEEHVQVQLKPEPDQEKEQDETPQPADEPKKDEEHEQEENHGIGTEIKEEDHGQEGRNGIANDIKEEATDQINLPGQKEANEHVSPEKEKKKGLGEGAAAPVSKRSKLRPPILFAGSALLVTLIILVINLIRAKKR